MNNKSRPKETRYSNILEEFLKENLEKDFKNDIEKSFLKIFESEINLWMKANLKNIIQTELNKFSSKIIAEKLK